MTCILSPCALVALTLGINYGWFVSYLGRDGFRKEEEEQNALNTLYWVTISLGKALSYLDLLKEASEELSKKM